MTFVSSLKCFGGGRKDRGAARYLTGQVPKMIMFPHQPTKSGGGGRLEKGERKENGRGHLGAGEKKGGKEEEEEELLKRREGEEISSSRQLSGNDVLKSGGSDGKKTEKGKGELGRP